MILLADLARIVILVLILAVIVLSWVTMGDHIGRVRHGPRKRLSRHIVKVALAHNAALVAMGTFTTLRIGRTPTLLLPVTLLAVVLTLSAMIDLVRFQVGGP